MAKLTLNRFSPGRRLIEFMEIQPASQCSPFGPSSSTREPFMIRMESGSAREMVRGKTIPASLGSGIEPRCHRPGF